MKQKTIRDVTRHVDYECAEPLRAAEIGVDVNELEIAERAAATLTESTRGPITYDALEAAYAAAISAAGGDEPDFLAVSPRTFAEIKACFQSQARFAVSTQNMGGGMRFHSAVIVRSDIPDAELRWNTEDGDWGTIYLR